MAVQKDRGGSIRVSTGAVIAVLAILVMAPGCTKDADTATTARSVADLPPDVQRADFAVRGSLEQVSVEDATPGEELALHDRSGASVAVGTADEQGSLLFRLVEPGKGYRVATTTSAVTASDPIDVRSVDGSVPEQSFYDDQDLAAGFTYITTRDGTTLSASVYLPGPVESGPYPTVVEYSGYDPSRPGRNLIQENAEALGPILGGDPDTLCAAVPFACDAPAQPGSLLALSMGYAVVAVNVRGTGCSGGAYDFFEPLQLTDGYDVVETVASQAWVRNHKVGMVGLSYPGIAQLFVAQTRPPSLAAITPLSVFDDTVRGTLAPGGIFNDGFALSWADEVGMKAQPYGQGWERARVDAGDTTCEANQKLRGQNVDAAKKAKEHRYYPPEIADPLNPSLFADRIEVPVYLTGSFQDEQTGGRFPLLFDEFTNAPVVHFTAMNGAHADGFAPVNLAEWKTFLDLYVADELTPVPPTVQVFAPLIMEQIFSANVALPPLRFLDGVTLEDARALYEAEPPIRILFESGAGDADQPGAPVPTAAVRTTTWPPPGTEPAFYHLGPDGTLTTDPPKEDGADTSSRFAVDPELARTTTFQGGTSDIFHALPAYDWRQEPRGSASVFVTEPLRSDRIFAGSASADLWIRTDGDGADVGVTLSEVRPDGKETFIQSGVLRSAMRKVAAGSTDLLPLHTGYETDAEPLERNEWTKMRVEIFPFAHVVRAGSRIRLSVHTPGGDRPRWTYIIDQQPAGTHIDVGHSPEHPSRLALPLSPDLLPAGSYPATLPPCPGLRGQPCRTFEEFVNTPTPAD